MGEAQGLLRSSVINTNLSGTVSGGVERGAEGAIAKAAVFNGTSGCVDFPADRGPVTGTGSFTISAWMRTAARSQQVVLQQRDLTATNGQFALQVDDLGQVRYWEGAGNSLNPTSCVAVYDGMWHHVVSVRSGANCFLYVDGLPAGSDRDTVAVSIEPLRDLAFAHNHRDGASYFAGGLDEIQINSGARSAKWVWACYMNQAPHSGFNAFGPVATAEFTDTNNNGMGDSWEYYYFGRLDHPDGGPEDDYDGDSSANSNEYYAATNPTNDASYLGLTDILPHGTDRMEWVFEDEDTGNLHTQRTLIVDSWILKWSSESNRVYRIHAGSNMTEALVPLTGDLPATPPINTFTNPMGGGSRLFYRIGVSPEP
jgi:hypothetical protein